jgi:hypothetical protein
MSRVPGNEGGRAYCTLVTCETTRSAWPNKAFEFVGLGEPLRLAGEFAKLLEGGYSEAHA